MLEPVLTRLNEDFEGALERLKDLLRIPSISTDPAYAAEVRRAAEWLADDLASIGFTTKIHKTPKHPIVTATCAEAEGAPHILYYGHYDVQPPDPLEQWTSPPFEPTIVDGPRGKRLVARGAVDDKGQLMTFVEAFRAWRRAHGTLPINVTVLLEGEEESGSPSLEPFLAANSRLLKADVATITDTGMWDVETPAITCMLRGLVYVEVTLHGPSHDLHSGGYGGAGVNPANALARMITSLKDDRGVVRVPRFYDDVRDISPAELEQWSRLPFDEKAFLAEAGLKTSTGEAGHGTLRRIWSRPTCDVNGMWSGYTGPGAKTIIPARASAKISFRLVPEQDPDRIYRAFVEFLKAQTPPDCRIEFTSHGASPAVRVATDSPWLRAAAEGLEEVFGRSPVLIGSGGTIPVVEALRRLLGVDSLLVGFGLDDDRVHSPNEKFELRCFEMGMRSQAAMMSRFAQAKSSKRKLKAEIGKS